LFLFACGIDHAPPKEAYPRLAGQFSTLSPTLPDAGGADSDRFGGAVCPSRETRPTRSLSGQSLTPHKKPEEMCDIKSLLPMFMNKFLGLCALLGLYGGDGQRAAPYPQ